MHNMKIQLQMFCTTILEKEWWFQENICVKRKVKRNILFIKNGVWFKIPFLDVVSGKWCLENVSGEWVILLIPIMKF